MSSAQSARPVEQPITDGWRTGLTDGQRAPLVAHFYLNGYSLCHRWVTTRLDRPWRAGDFKCVDCRGRTHA